MARNVSSPGAALSRTNRPQAPTLSEPGRLIKSRSGDTLKNDVAGLGSSRDKRAHTYYGYPRVTTRFELENMYRSSWLAKRIVNGIADDMTREWRDFIFGDDDDNPQLEALKLAEKLFAVRRKFNEAFRWARLYGGALIILGVGDDDDLDQPLDPATVKKGDLKWMHVVDRWRCAPGGTINRDLESPNFGYPDMYVISESNIEVHHTRVLRFDGEKLPYFSFMQNGMWHDSNLQHGIDALLDHDTTVAAIATMMFEANVDVISSDDLSELLTTKSGEKKVIDRFAMSQLMKSMNRTLILDKDETYTKKSNNFSGLDKIANVFMTAVCGAYDYPMTKLFGQAPGGLDATGDGDMRNYYDMCASKQESEGTPVLDQFDQIFVRSVLGSMPAEYKSVWKSLWQTSDVDQSTIDLNNAQRDIAYLGASVVSEGLVASELKLKGTYKSMSGDDVKLAEELGDKNHEDEMNTDPNAPPVLPAPNPGDPNPPAVLPAPAKAPAKRPGTPATAKKKAVKKK